MPPHFFEKATKESAPRILWTVVKPWMLKTATLGSPYVIQQDDASAHTRCSVQNWLCDFTLVTSLYLHLKDLGHY